jgi:hypothetical protein
MNERSDDMTVERLEEQVRILGHAVGIEVTDPLTAIPPSVIELARGDERDQAVRELKRLGMGLTEASRAVDAASGAELEDVTGRWYSNEWLWRLGMVAAVLLVGYILSLL